LVPLSVVADVGVLVVDERTAHGAHGDESAEDACPPIG